MERKNLLIVTSYMSGKGGIEKIIQRMNALLSDKKNLEITVVSLTGGDKNIGESNKKIGFHCGEEEWLFAMKAHRFPFSFGSRLVNFFFHVAYMVCFLIKNHFEYVICTGPAQALYLKKLRRIFNFRFKIYAWPHFSLTSHYGDFSLCKNADYCLGISKEICSQLVKSGVAKDRVIYFPNPFEREKLVVRERGLEGVVNFVYIGRLIFEGQKRIKDIIDACLHVHGNFKVHLIGDGPDVGIIEDYVEINNLSHKILLHQGWHVDPWVLIKEPDALLLSSAFEGLPTVLGEAMSRGIFCISSDCKTGPRDFIDDQKNGYIFPVGDVLALSSIIQKVVNRGCKFEPAEISKSIEFLYTENYIKRFDAVFGGSEL